MNIEDLSELNQARIADLPNVLRVKIIEKILGKAAVGEKGRESLKRTAKTQLHINQLIELYETMAEIGEFSESQAIRMAVNTFNWKGQKLKRNT